MGIHGGSLGWEDREFCLARYNLAIRLQKSFRKDCEKDAECICQEVGGVEG